MADLPGSGYLSNDLRTEGEMKTALEQLHDVIAELGSKQAPVMTLSGNAITAPLASMVLVQSQTHAEDSGDALDEIGTTNITQGRVVILKNNDATSTESAGQTITINNGSGAGLIALTEGTGSFLLCAERMLAVIYSGTQWVEVWRSYGRANSEDALAERTSLGLGDASVEAIAASAAASAGKVLKVGGSNITADAILAIDSSGNLKAGTVTGGNADTLDTLDSTAFVRTDSGSAQAIDANVTSTTAGETRIASSTTGASATTGFSMLDGAIERGSVYIDTQDGDLYLETKDSEGAEKASIKIDAATSSLQYNSEPGTYSWQTLLAGEPSVGHGLPGLDADTLDGTHLSGINALILALVAGDSGSIELNDGTTTLLVQWPSDDSWVGAGSGAAGTWTWTFPTSYASTPSVIGGWISSGGVGGSYTQTATYIRFAKSYYAYPSSFNWYQIGKPLVIGVPA